MYKYKYTVQMNSKKEQINIRGNKPKHDFSNCAINSKLSLVNC